jgi:hypothetical protein
LEPSNQRNYKDSFNQTFLIQPQPVAQREDMQKQSSSARRKERLLKWAWIALAPFAIGLFFLSQQQNDLAHSSGFVSGLISEGLSFYETAKATDYGSSSYTPGLYLLLGLAISPALIIKRLVGGDACSLNPPIDCFAESLSLKTAIVCLAFASCWLFRLVLNNPDATARFRPRRRALALLGVPVVLYSWLFFGAYDGLGGFTAIIGSLLFLDRNDLGKKQGLSEKALMITGLTIASLSVSAKFFPIVIVLGICIGFARSARDFAVCMIVPSLLTAIQIVFAATHGGAPLSIAADKLVQEGPLLYGRVTAAIAIVSFTIFIAARYAKTANRPALGFTISTAIYAIGYPAIIWHPQWQIYYGIALFFAFTYIPVSARLSRIFAGILAIQAIAFAFATQFWADNADITMSISLLQRKLIPSIHDAMGDNGLDASMVINRGWVIYSLSQLASVVLLALALERQRRNKIMNLDLKATSKWPAVGAVVFLVLWSLMNTASIAGTHDWKLRISAVFENIPFDVGHEVGTANRSHSSKKMISLNDGTVHTFSLDSDSYRGSLIQIGTVTIGNNLGQSKGLIRLCLSSEESPTGVARSDSSDEECANLDLRKTRDNRASWFRFMQPTRNNWHQLRVYSFIDKGSPIPVLYIKPNGNPFISLYGTLQGRQEGRELNTN